MRHNTDPLFHFIFILIHFPLSASRAGTLYCLFVIPSYLASLKYFIRRMHRVHFISWTKPLPHLCLYLLPDIAAH